LGATLIHLATGVAPADLPQHNLRLQFADRVSLNPRFSYWLDKLIDPATEQRFSSARQGLESLTAAVAPEALTTSQPSISPVTVLSVFAVLIAFIAGGISIYFSIAFFLKNQQFKATNELEAKTYLRAMNRAQTFYYMKYKKFSNSLEKLELGIKTETDNYTYYTYPYTVNNLPPETLTEKQIFDWMLKDEINQDSISSSSNQIVVNYAISRQENLRSYVGFVSNGIHRERTRVELSAILCQANNPGTIYPSIPTYQTGHLACATGTSSVWLNYR